MTALERVDVSVVVAEVMVVELAWAGGASGVGDPNYKKKNPEC